MGYEPAGMLRIVVVGESVAFGNGVEDETWPARLETLLRQRRPDLRAEVVNASVPGGPARVFALVDEVVPALGPDLLVLAPGGPIAFHEHALPDGGYRIDLPPERRSALIGEMQQGIRRVADNLAGRGIRLVLVTPTFNSFALPESRAWIGAVTEAGARHGLPVLDTNPLLAACEREGGTVFERDGAVQRLLGCSNSGACCRRPAVPGPGLDPRRESRVTHPAHCLFPQGPLAPRSHGTHPCTACAGLPRQRARPVRNLATDMAPPARPEPPRTGPTGQFSSGVGQEVWIHCKTLASLDASW
jgi:hypothetical protein